MADPTPEQLARQQIDAMPLPSLPPSGARFYRCALQVNPPDYAEKYQGRLPLGRSSTDYVDSILAIAREQQIDVLAITDHHSVDAIAEFESRARPLGITIFPGFEASSSEGVHVLCLFDPGTTRDALNKALGQIGTRTTRPPATRPVVQLIGQVERLGGVTIAAHVHDDNGLLEKLSGEPRVVKAPEDLTSPKTTWRRSGARRSMHAWRKPKAIPPR